MDKFIQWVLANPIFIVILIIILLLLYVIFTYNNLNAKKHRVEKSFSTIDVFLQKRFDQMTSLFEQVLENLDHETELYTKIAEIRTQVKDAKNGSINDKVKAANNLNSLAAGSILTVENYPELATVKSIGAITSNATIDIEGEIAGARNQYNSNVTSFNTKISSFPAMLLAGIFGFKTPFELFKAPEEVKVRPSITSIKEDRYSDK